MNPMEGERRCLRGSRLAAMTGLIVMALALAACGGQSPATQEPDPATWFVIHTAAVDGTDLAVVEPGGSKVVPINLEPGRYTLSVRGDPAIVGTLVVT